MIAILFDMEITRPPNVREKATRDPTEFEKKEYYTTFVYSPCKITTFNTLEKRGYYMTQRIKSIVQRL